MPQVYDNAVPITVLEQGLYYINGAVISNDATTPNTILDISAGIMRDASNTYDLNLGNYNGQVNPNPPANFVSKINSALLGLGGIDTGTVAANTLYKIYVVADPVSGLPSGCIMSLALPSVGPLLPFGYSVYRHIGYWPTDGSANFLLGYSFGTRSSRSFTYDAPISVGTTASSASYAAINLTKFVPLVNNTPVLLNVSLTGTAADTMNLQPGNATGDAVIIEAQVTSQAIKAQVTVLAQNTTISMVLSPTINYKNSGTDTITVAVGGFSYVI